MANPRLTNSVALPFTMIGNHGVLYNERERQRLLGNPSVNDDEHQSTRHKSLPYGMSNVHENNQMLTKSYSIHADGEVSYLTPLQLGRHQVCCLFYLDFSMRSITDIKTPT